MHANNRKHLVIAPHHDDEIMGCGGTIAKAIKNGDQARIIIVTRGELSGIDGSIEQNVQIRENECKRACEIIGTQDIHFLKEKDRALAYRRDLVEKVLMHIDDYRPDYVYYPHSEEADRDHRIVHEITSEALFLSRSNFLRNKNRIKRCLQYEIWTPLTAYQLVSDISSVIDQKMEALNAYKSQGAILQLENGVKGLNAYRGMQVGTDFAEIFKF
ncbi:PIG-L family deacetylase [Bacillus vallismortis]|uniref:PIG-L family deacetylase n=1 Tax=Bacillus vallismortis TaxID=72361 RepID=A0AAP3CJP8_BACVA|nr:PIG-L family deacetylase [Bacillus vallismortis]MCY8316240.1 PIG-L family deacetylase [Bacillus vallismortis]MEC1650997.1 PIG-L family deacetylase [Bacillus vallismortis]